MYWQWHACHYPPGSHSSENEFPILPGSFRPIHSGFPGGRPGYNYDTKQPHQKKKTADVGGKKQKIAMVHGFFLFESSFLFQWNCEAYIVTHIFDWELCSTSLQLCFFRVACHARGLMVVDLVCDLGYLSYLLLASRNNWLRWLKDRTKIFFSRVERWVAWPYPRG